MIKYFITKNFIGFPTGVVNGEYSNTGKLIESACQFIPKQLKDNTQCFDRLEDISNYKYCKCGDPDCTYNAELYRIVNKILHSQNAL